MVPKLFSLYGPLEINGFNGALIAGLALFFYAALRHKDLEKYISKADFVSICIESAIAGIIGGRILHIMSEWSHYESYVQMLSIWNGGLSILGAFIGVLIYSLWTLRQKNLPVWELYDIAALYAPLIHGVARIGCFLVGCCHGCTTTLPWAITYTHPQVVAPLHTPLHPTQLYSALIFFLIFCFLFVKASKKNMKPGALSLLYVIGMSFERWFVDFFRGDRIALSSHSPLSFFSFHQWIALGILSIAALLFWFTHRHNRVPHESV